MAWTNLNNSVYIFTFKTDNKKGGVMDNIKILVLGVLLFGLALPAQARLYKWIDEAGKVHYTQKPPPPEGRRATINTETFSTVQTVKAPPIPKQTPRPRTQTKPQVRRTRCNRR